MSGFYPDTPYHRIGWDRVGQFMKINKGTGVVSSVYSDAQMGTLNSENQSYVAVNEPRQWAILLEEEYDIDAFLWVNEGTASSSGGSFFEYSSDTTNGIDGTWTSMSLPTFETTASLDLAALRNFDHQGMNVFSTPIRCRAIRAGNNGGSSRGNVRFIGLWGEPVNPKKLVFWHPTEDEKISDPAYFDWGDRYINQTIPPKSFRIKNTHDTMAASDISISVEALYNDGGTPNIIESHSLSNDGSTYESSVDIAALAPGEVSDVIYLKFDPSSGSMPNLKFARVIAAAESWS